MNTEQLRELVEIDYTGFHGPVGSALVTGPGYGSPWFETVALIGYYCEDENHTEGECDCVTEDTLRRATLDHLTGLGLTPIRGY